MQQPRSFGLEYSASTRQAVLYIEAVCRGFIARQETQLLRMHDRANRLQLACRTFLAKRRLRKLRHNRAAQSIQLWYRSKMAVRHVRPFPSST